MNKHYLFISRPSSHYRYYKKLTAYLGKNAALHKLSPLVLPSLKYWHRACSLDANELIDTHVKRKQVRHPLLCRSPKLLSLVKSLYLFRERCRASHYFSVLEKSSCTTVVMWNGMKQPNRTPYLVAQACGKETMLFENGLLPDTTVLDPKGVNARNSLPRDPEYYLNQTTNVRDLNKQLEIRKPHKHRKTAPNSITLPPRFVFVPFQVPNDTQIVCHSPWIASMESFYQALEQGLEHLQQRGELPFVFVVKEHPSWPRSFTHLHHKNPNIIFANNNTQELIENALAVITINSTVGIESLLLDKAVLTLGDAFYNIEGLAHHCDSQQTFNQALETLEQRPVNSLLLQKFLAYLKSEYLLPQAWKTSELSEAHLHAVKMRLEYSYVPETEPAKEVA